MMKKTIIHSLSWLLLLQWCLAQSISDLPLNNRQSILNDRVFLTFPDSAQNKSRPVDIMSADWNINDETRIMMDMGEMRLVFFAQELYLLGDDKLLEVLKDDKDKQFVFTHKVLTPSDSLMSVLSTPTKWDSTQKAILINTLTIKTKDDAIIRISAYINPPAMVEKQAFTVLTERIFRTLEKGNRENPRTARVEKHKMMDSKSQLQFQLPDDFIVRIDQKYDFQVFRISKYQKMGEEDFQSMTIYLGYHPSFFHKRQGFKDYTEIQPIVFLGEEAQFMYFENPQKSIYLLEQILHPESLGDLRVHIACVSNQAENIALMKKILSDIQLIKE